MARVEDSVMLYGKYKHETANACLFEVQRVGDSHDLEEPKKLWFPFSQIHQIHRNQHPLPDKIQVSAWIARTKELV
jgi:hypothetical protein